ncbi:MAG: DUF3793 family protein [Clostridia bacterium]|nr:DUF3793 family protein [Clostridia bacterium]
MLERAIIDHASPTLARLKLGNLFNHTMESGFPTEYARLRRQLMDKGVTMTILKVAHGKALIYIYRARELEKALMSDGVRRLLRACGYDSFDVNGALDTLKARLNGIDAFPHEIGVFLGYPLEDVVGFIENGGRNCLSCGCWKVYSNECEALKAFERYEKCKAVYQRLFASGCPLTRLTVAARSAS